MMIEVRREERSWRLRAGRPKDIGLEHGRAGRHERLVRALERSDGMTRTVLAEVPPAGRPAFRTYLRAKRKTFRSLVRALSHHTEAHVVAIAAARYRELPVIPECSLDVWPELVGEERALEMFFAFAGVPEESVEDLRRVRPRIVHEPMSVS